VSAAGRQAAAWQRCGERSAWLAAGPAGAVLTVSALVGGGWQPQVHRPGAARPAAADCGPVLTRRLAAQRWAERRPAS
jgi:hypothetical protein